MVVGAGLAGLAAARAVAAAGRSVLVLEARDRVGGRLLPERIDRAIRLLRAVWACELRDVSLLHVLFCIRSAGSFDVLINTAGGAQEKRFAGGSQLLSLNFADYFGRAAAHPRRYLEMTWSAEPWTRGCYVGYTPPGVLLDYGPAIRQPVGRIHWAGAETATRWNGYMDGALTSGGRAAREALEAL